ncbi:MAG: LysR family transcriptional regulator [Myxococcales bacterium]|nr:LysR family transcriptional regulator [Myxococcales bacterium]
MNFDLRQLDAFCRVVESGSFTIAASELGLSQAAVSERIARLEAATGCKLLDRLGREIRPSAAGSWLYRRALEVVRAHRQLERDFRQFVGLEVGELAIGASTIPGEEILPGLTASFQRVNPGVRVQVRVYDSAGVVRALQHGEIELGFVGARSEDAHLSYVPLWRDLLVVVVPSGHPWAARSAVSLEELVTQPFLLREPGSGTRDSLAQALVDRGSGPGALNVVVELGSSQAIKNAVLAGAGISVVSERAVRHEVELGLLRSLRVEELDLTREFYLVDDPRRSRSPACERYLDFVVATADSPLAQSARGWLKRSIWPQGAEK